MIKKIISLKKFQFLLLQLIKRDFKVKYRGSVLGVLWSVFNPLLNMVVLSIVFSNVFKTVGNYQLYLLSGLLIFNYFSEATNTAIHGITGNFGLITKVYFPKFILPLSKVLSSSINLLITLAVFFIIGIFLGIKFTLGLLLIPFLFLFLILFTTGVSFIVSTLQVFFRDTAHLFGVILMIWMYATPIMYPVEIISENILPIYKLNPMYIFIDFLRKITLDGIVPDPINFVSCALWGTGMFLFGGFVFVKNQNKFIYYT